MYFKGDKTNNIRSLIYYFTFKKWSVDGDKHLEHIICPTPSWFATHLHFWHGYGLAVSVTRLAHTSMNFLTVCLCVPLTLYWRWCKLKRVPFVSNAKGVHISFGSLIYKAGYTHIDTQHGNYMCDFRLLPRSIWELPSSGLLCSK